MMSELLNFYGEEISEKTKVKHSNIMANKWQLKVKYNTCFRHFGYLLINVQSDTL